MVSKNLDLLQYTVIHKKMGKKWNKSYKFPKLTLLREFQAME